MELFRNYTKNTMHDLFLDLNISQFILGRQGLISRRFFKSTIGKKKKGKKEIKTQKKHLNKELLENGETSHITVNANIPPSSVTRVVPLPFFFFP